MITAGSAGVGAGENDVKLALLATCSGGTCPSVYLDEQSADDADLVVQGYPVTDRAAGIPVPEGESLVRIPKAVLIEAAARLSSVT